MPGNVLNITIWSEGMKYYQYNNTSPHDHGTTGLSLGTWSPAVVPDQAGLLSNITTCYWFWSHHRYHTTPQAQR